MLHWNFGWEPREAIEWSTASSPWNQQFTLDSEKKIKFGQDFYLTITYSPETEMESVYLDGIKLGSTRYAKTNWDKFVKINLPSLTTFCVGRCSMTGEGYWAYSNCSVYATRLYAKALTDEEVKGNYNKTVKYLQLLSE